MKWWLSAALLLAMGGTAQASDHRLPEEDLGEMAAGRLRLEEVLDSRTRARYPGMAATAELRFACWSTNPEARAPGGSYAACRADFMELVAALERLQQQDDGGPLAAH